MNALRLTAKPNAMRSLRSVGACASVHGGYQYQPSQPKCHTPVASIGGNLGWFNGTGIS
jgi:hypothetical protein